ncbi:MAG: hypothetical protein RBJ76_25575 [Stenomitos frigidus ULC029]
MTALVGWLWLEQSVLSHTIRQWLYPAIEIHFQDRSVRLWHCGVVTPWAVRAIAVVGWCHYLRSFNCLHLKPNSFCFRGLRQALLV